MPLTNITVRNLQPRDKIYKVSDGAGLHVVVQPGGQKHWRFAYRFAGKQKTLSLGSFPDISVARARELRDDAKRTLRQGVDPGAPAAEGPGGVTFEQAAREWFDRWKIGKDKAHSDRVWARLSRDGLSELGRYGISHIGPRDVIAAVRKVEARGAIDIARRLKQTVGQIFRYAIASGYVDRDPAASIGDALQAKPRTRHMAALRADELPAFMAALGRYDGHPQTAAAIRLTLLTWVRTNETRFARWEEFEGLSGAEPLWRIPAERMKMRREHVVPLSSAVVTVLEGLHPRPSGAVFPSDTIEGVMSNNTMLYAMYRMGYHSRATVHGFRRTASTMANEHGWNSDWIERQLAHVEDNEVRAAYNSAQWIKGRREMMNWWAGVITAAEEDEFSSLI